MAPTPPYLPQELVDSIIDYVDNDRSTLFSCALVSRSWLHSSRYHLFANISISPLSQSTIPPQRLCARLYQTLQESPVIIPYIRTLQILDTCPPPHQRSGQWITNERTLPPLLKLLTHLRQLELGAPASSNTLQWKSLPFTLQNAICTVLKLPTLAYFRLQSWIFPNLVSLAAVLSSCHNLKGLSLSAVTVCEDLDHHPRHSESSGQTKAIIPPPPPLLVSADSRTCGERLEHDTELILDDELDGASDTVNTRVSAPRLEALTLDYVNFGYLGYWLFAPSQSPPPISFGNLRELRISHSADPLVVEQILFSIGPALEHLHLKPGSWDVFPFDLRNNANLKSLRLTLEVPGTALSWCTTLLSSLSPSSFNTSPSSSSTSATSSALSDYDLQLTHISLEFWTDLKKLSSSPSTSPSSSPHHVSTSLLPSSSSSPISSSLTLTSQSASSPSADASSSRLPDQNHTPSRRRSLPYSQATWSSLDSVLSLLPSPLERVDVGLFAQPSSPDFVHVKETLSGIHARMNADDVDDDEGNTDNNDNTESPLKDIKENGVVRVYQLGVKSQRSFGRICGPRLRSFEGTN